MTVPLAWVDERIAAHGLTRSGPPVLHREWAWATVHRVPTDGGPVWLKTMPPSTAYEAALYPVLAEVVPGHVLVPLGADAGHGRLLLPDAGPSLRDRVGRDGTDERLVGAVAAFADVQQVLAGRTDDLLAAGVPDLRPAALPDRFDEAVDGVAALGQDVAALRSARRLVEGWARDLAATGRPASLDHGDLHGANVVGTDAAPRFVDWGDAAVCHPFACLLTVLDTSDPRWHARLRDAYLARWGDPAALRDEADLAVRLADVARALAWLRAIGGDPVHEHADAPAAHLRRLTGD